MEQEREGAGTEEDRGSRSGKGLAIVAGAGLGYLVGRTLLNKPILGTLLGVALALMVGSWGEK